MYPIKISVPRKFKAISYLKFAQDHTRHNPKLESFVEQNTIVRLGGGGGR